MPFANGTRPTAAELNAALGPMIQSGLQAVSVPVADEPYSYPITFPTPFPSPPRVQVTARDVVGATVRGVSVRQISATGCTLAVFRTATGRVLLQWTAILEPERIVAGQIVTANHLNQGSGEEVMQVGQVSITPDPNEPTSKVVNFPSSFAAPPRVHTTALTGTPSVIRGTGATTITEDDARIWLIRSNNTVTTVMWIAVGFPI